MLFLHELGFFNPILLLFQMALLTFFLALCLLLLNQFQLSFPLFLKLDSFSPLVSQDLVLIFLIVTE